MLDQLLIMAAALEIYKKCCRSSEKVVFNISLKVREGFIEEGLYDLCFAE